MKPVSVEGYAENSPPPLYGPHSPDYDPGTKKWIPKNPQKSPDSFDWEEEAEYGMDFTGPPPEFYRDSAPEFFEKGMQKKYGDNWKSIVSKIDEKYPNRKQYDNSNLLQTVFNRAELDNLIDKERQKTLGIDDEESSKMVDVLGEVSDDTGEKIITKVVEKTNNEGLNKLLAIDEDSKEEDEDEENSDIKSVSS